jgi:crossover junction endodeoxyribonuclease RusA
MISQKGRDYTNMVKRIVMVNKLKESFMNGEELHVSVKLIPPDRRQRDIDNYTKGIFDSLSKANFWGDDSQVKILTIEMQEPKKPGFAQLEITQREVNHEA